MEKQYKEPARSSPAANKGQSEQGPSVSMWTLSYRLQGMSFALALAAVYCHFLLHDWPYQLLIAAGVLGYFLGWAIGRFLYSRRH